jgi:alpha-1,3-fucosyltransferase
MTYRQDSDIYLRDYYGSLVKRSSQNENSSRARYIYNSVENINYSADKTKNTNNLRETDKLIKNRDLTSFIKGKKKMITWFVGHCTTPIRREEYVQQLSKYIPVDIFGKCTKECPSNCDEMVRTDYKFYLAFENSWCPDYITEKFSRPLLYGAVPIVLGGADYRKFAPLNSYINARDFNSPKELADYLILLDKSDSLYINYFNWMKDYYISVPDMNGWCQLCQMAHDNKIPTKVYHDIKRWWMNDGGECETDSTKYF